MDREIFRVMSVSAINLINLSAGVRGEGGGRDRGFSKVLKLTHSIMEQKEMHFCTVLEPSRVKISRQKSNTNFYWEDSTTPNCKMNLSEKAA